ncbi:MAG: hypothetical protein BGN97_10285 [Microbacterium sp. 69-10]|nr:MAG: hypothetical protein BGN97_10285 [Microbacterium sp. 69-10]
MVEQKTEGARRRVTREDVARLAQVSVPVVSYVLNDGPKNVSPATRDRVLDAVDRLGYKPNAAARALRRGRSDLLGFIVPSIANPLFASFALEVERAAAARKATVITVSARAGQVGVALERLASHQVDAVLVATGLHSADVAAVERSGLKAVLLNQPSSVPGMPTFSIDLYGGVRAAVTHLIDRGHARIAYLGPADGDPRRYSGWADAMTSRDLTLGPHIPADFSRASGREAIDQLLELPERPTAIFASSDQIAIGALLGLHRAGIHVPNEIAVASFDDSPDAQFTWPPLTAVHQPLREMADDALELIVSGTGPTERMYDAQLVVRESTIGAPGV